MNLGRLSYAQSLRAIGESIETRGFNTFELEKYGENYRLQVLTNETSRRGGFLKKLAQLLGIADHSPRKPSTSTVPSETLSYTPSDITRLVTEQQARHGTTNVMPNTNKLGQVLRVLGDYLDHKEAYVFKVSVSGQSLSVAFETDRGMEQENFTIENLYDHAIRMYLRRSERLERAS